MSIRLPHLVRIVTLAGCVASIACNSNTSSQPSSALTASVSSPRPAQPEANASVRFTDQPITLIVQNAVVTTTSDTVYVFEVATDSAFASKVQTKEGIAQGGNGQTGVRLDALTGGKDYYWRARANGGGTTGPFSALAKFTVGPPITISDPAPLAPLTGTSTSPRPSLRVANVSRSGPAGAITYLFEISTSAVFTPVLVSGTKSEGANETDFIPASDLPVNVTLYWRVTAIDASNGVSSNKSSVQTFTAKAFSQAEALALQIGSTLWTGAAPPGTTGHATMGEGGPFGVGWQIQTLYYAPQNITFQSPDLEMLRLFDLSDRGMDPVSAINWMNTNGYPTDALWYPPPEKGVIGLHTVYLATRGKVLTNPTWDIVLRVE